MQEPSSRHGASRREFVRVGFRYALLTGLAVVSAVLVKRRSATLPNQNCISNGVCRGCAIFTDCGLPQALSAKQFQQRNGA
jgi:hypothetical protein